MQRKPSPTAPGRTGPMANSRRCFGIYPQRGQYRAPATSGAVPVECLSLVGTGVRRLAHRAPRPTRPPERAAAAVLLQLPQTPAASNRRRPRRPGAREARFDPIADSPPLPARARAGTWPVPLTVERRDQGSRTEITLNGEIDLLCAPLVRRALTQCLDDGACTIEVDLTRVTFCDASGLSAFLSAHRRATALGGSLHLSRPAPVVARPIALACAEALLLGPQDGTPDGITILSLPSPRSA